MVKTTLLKTTGKTALLAAVMSGSALMAQEAPVPAPEAAAPPVVQAPPATVVAPPPVVRTLPTENDIVNPAAAEQAAAEQKPVRATAQPERRAAAPAVRATRSDTVSTSIPAPAPTLDVAPTFNEPTAPVVDDINDTPVAAVDATDVAAMPSDNAAESAEDLTLFAGLAAALAALGLGGLFVSRRRNRTPKQDYRAAAIAQPTPEPRPVTESRPVFQPVATPVAAERPSARKPVLSRPDIPVTDPLFSTPVHAGPITDPLFAPRNDVEIPITDPLFAKNLRFSGRARDAEPALIAEPVN